MPERKATAAPKRGRGKGHATTDAERAAGRKNLERGRKAKQARAAAARAEDRETADERWSKLLDGTLTVADLDDEEVRRCKVRARDGSFNRGRAVPSHLAQQFQSELLKRAQGKLREALPAAIMTLMELAQDPECPEAVRKSAADSIVNRVLGKAPETVNIKTDDHWGKLLGEALDVDRELRDLDR